MVKYRKYPSPPLKTASVSLTIFCIILVFIYGIRLDKQAVELGNVARTTSQEHVKRDYQYPSLKDEILNQKDISSIKMIAHNGPQKMEAVAPAQEDKLPPPRDGTTNVGDYSDGKDKNSFVAQNRREEKIVSKVDNEEHLERNEEGNATEANKREIGREFLNALSRCKEMLCVQKAHEKYPRGSKMFNFPEFIIIGFQKAATTSLKGYLSKHESVITPGKKEPNFFTDACLRSPPELCPPEESEKYIRNILLLDEYLKANGTLAANEASTHIVRSGQKLAPKLRKLMPWLKIIVQLREPISRAASMLIHNEDAGNPSCLRDNEMGDCLLHHSQLSEMTPGLYEALTYTEAMAPWIQEFPREQILVLQYESLVNEDSEEDNLNQVKEFLNLDLSKPQGGLDIKNARRFRINPEGWEVKKKHYDELIQLVRPDVYSLVDILSESGLIEDKSSWLEKWESIWRENLASCDNTTKVCNMMLS